MKRILLMSLAALMLAAPAIARAEGGKFKVYGMLAYVSPLSETDQDVGGVVDAVKASSELGYNFGVEFRAGSLLGIEFDYLYAKHDVEHDTQGLLGETTFQPISGTVNLHLPIGDLDLYGGPTAAYVNWGDLELPSGGGKIELDPEFAFGLSAGVDLTVTPMVAVTGGLRWLNVKAEPKDAANGEGIDVHPLFARAGFALRF